MQRLLGGSGYLQAVGVRVGGDSVGIESQRVTFMNGGAVSELGKNQEGSW